MDTPHWEYPSPLSGGALPAAAPPALSAVRYAAAAPRAEGATECMAAPDGPADRLGWLPADTHQHGGRTRHRGPG